VLLDSELGWLVGFIEGEGCFCMTHKTSGTKNSVHSSFNVTNTDPLLIQKAKHIIDEIVGYKVSVIRHPVMKPCYKPIWRLWIESCKGLSIFIKTILPYLVGEKRLQASIMLQFVDRRIQLRGDNYKAPKYTEEDWKYLEAMKAVKNTKESVETIRSLSHVDKDIVRTEDITKTSELSGNRIAQHLIAE
jgi:hypothetical protein